MRRLFLDANIILSFHFNDAEKPQQKAIDFIFSNIEQRKWEGHISLITFYQLLYFIDKKIKNPVTSAKRAYKYLDIIQLTPFAPGLLTEMDINHWPDYEDGLQYICALSGKCDAIISTNSNDYFASTLPVIDPLNFVLQYG